MEQTSNVLYKKHSNYIVLCISEHYSAHILIYRDIYCIFVLVGNFVKINIFYSIYVILMKS